MDPKQIYTYVTPSLLVINPYRRVPHLMTPDILAGCRTVRLSSLAVRRQRKADPQRHSAAHVFDSGSGVETDVHKQGASGHRHQRRIRSRKDRGREDRHVLFGRLGLRSNTRSRREGDRGADNSVQPGAGGVWEREDAEEHEQQPLWEVREDHLQHQDEADFGGDNEVLPAGEVANSEDRKHKSRTHRANSTATITSSTTCSREASPNCCSVYFSSMIRAIE
jgi:hypothetical protein